MGFFSDLFGGGGSKSSSPKASPSDKVNSQNFAPRAAGPMSYLSPVSTIAKSVMDQTRYGMNDRAKVEDARRAALGGPSYYNETPAQRAQMARAPQMAEQKDYAFIGSPTTDSQRAAVAAGLVSPTGEMLTGGASGGEGGLGAGASIPTGSQDSGTFNPVTFRNGNVGALAGTAGMSGLLGQGTGLFGQAGDMAQQAPSEFNYNFDPEGRSQQLFDQRSALLAPQFAQQRAMNNESMFGGGRLGLRLAGEGVGAGSGMVQPDAFGMNQAQSQALAQLAAQSTNDAYSQQMQQAGLDLSQFGTNQALRQQQYGNLMGAGQGMLGAGLSNAGLIQQQQALDQGYSIDQDRNDISRLTAQAAIDRGNYQADPWLTGAVGLGTSFLGTDTGSSWLSNLFT